MLTGPAWAGPEEFKLREIQKAKSVKGHDLKPGTKNTPAPATQWKPTPVAWPTPGTAEVTLPATSSLANTNLFTQSQAGSLPVRVTRTAQPTPSAKAKSLAPAKDTAAPGRVKVSIADRDKTRQAGIEGLLLSVQRSDGSSAAGTAQVEVDYSKIKGAYGANWASSLQLIELPACALTTPAKPECLKGTPLRTRNNPLTGTLSAAVNLPAAPATATSTKGMSASAGASWLAAPSAGMTVLAAAPGADGSDGSFKATSLSASGSWSAGGNSGGFGWNVPIAVPPVPGGLSPKVGLSYGSSSIDGRTGSTNNQASWVGEGWEYNPGFIERKYVPCENDKQGGNNTEKVGDLCWKSENATMSLNGSSNELLWDAGKKVWKLSNDDGSRVERIYDAPGNNSGDADSEYWRVTTTDGSQYWFGKNRLPGWTTGKEETKSVNSVPVFGNHAGEQGRGADFASSSEMQGWRWNLDYVVDPHGNAMALYYNRYTAHYAKNGKIDAPVAYSRDSVLTKISYGLRAGEVYTPALAPAQVNFNVSNRCTAGTCTLDEAHATDWPDVPVHLNCKASGQCLHGSPTFWSTKRLTSIDTVALVGTAHQNVDTWTLAQSYPSTGDTSTPALWLDSIQHTGKAGALADITLPKTVFTGTPMPNRVDKADGRPPINKRRITQITNETGANTFVTYSPAECSPTNLPAADDTNTKRCYPSWWTRDGGTEEVKDYFHKYLVTKVEDTDTTAGTGSPSTATTYEYPGTPNWRRDQGEFTLDKHRTWGDFHGYRTVRTLAGSTNRIKSETDYYTGMAGDKLANGTDRTVAAINGVTDRADFGGRVAGSRSYASETGPVVEKSTQTPWESGTTASQSVVGMTDPDKPTTPGPALEPRLSRLSGSATVVTSKLLADGTNWQHATTTRTYDPVYGLLLTEGDDGGKTTETNCTITQYANPDTTNWLIAYPRQITSTTSTPCSDTFDAPSAISASRISYDDQAVGTAPKAGQTNITKTEQAAKLDAGNQFVWDNAGRTTHDQYGRTLTATGQDGQTTTTAYTPATGVQPTSVTVTNPKGHTTSSTYDGLRGLALTTTEANNRAVTSEYDALGRLVKGWGVGRASSQPPNVTFSYNVSATAPSTVTTKKLFEDGLMGTSVTFYDSLLRQRQTQSDATGVVGRTITDTFYDDHGRNHRSNAPYYNSQTVNTTMFVVPDNQVPSAAENDYDSRGRVTDSIVLSLNQEKWRTTLTYGPDWQAVVPPQGATATLTVTDARGRAVERRQYKDRNPVIQAANTQFEKYNYAYDRSGKLAKITDSAARNSWTYAYDLRGRSTVVTDPDKGKTTTTYGTDGRTATVTDARGVTLASTYDELGRPTSLRKGTVTGAKLAEWTYDTATAGKGLPATSTHYDGAAAYTNAVTGYSGAGTPTATKVTIPSISGEEKLAGTYTITGTTTPTNNHPATAAYSTTNTNATTALPAETVTNTYGAQDQLAIVGSNLNQAYLRGAGYTEFGELAQAQLGNLGSMITQTLSRDPLTRRVVRADVDRQASAPGNLSSTKYTYDLAGNITRVLDEQNDLTVKDDQCFTYDWAARLSEAWTSGDNCTTKPLNGAGTPNLGTVDPYWTSWTFTDTGQRATETQHKAGPVTADTTRTHTYPTTAGAAQGHALRSVKATGGATGTDTYGYDATGNMTGKTPATGNAQTMTWNDEGKLASSTIAGATTSFLYDTSGTRIIKREPAATTLYLPGGQELVLDKTTGTVSGTRYYSVPGGTAMRTSTDGRVRFLVADHHGTNTLSIAAGTLSFNRRKQLPYGGERGTPPAAWPSQKGFVGGDIDKTTSLTHIGARDYDTKLGQFISVDPLLSLDQPQSLNGYNYANNNPTTNSDPTGERNEECGTLYDCAPGGRITFSNTKQVKTRGSGNDSGGRVSTKHSIESNFAGIISKTTKKPGPPTVTSPDGDVYTFPTANQEEFKQIYRTSYLNEIADYGGIPDDPKIDWDIKIHAMLEACQKLADRGCDPATFVYANAWSTVQVAGFFEGGGIARPSVGLRGTAKGKGKSGVDCNKCFLAGTDVLMADGTTKNIEDVEPGDEVKATDPETGESGSRQVTRLIITEDDKSFNTLSIATEEGIEELTATHEHPFWSPSAHAWVEARNLTAGATLLTDDGTTVIVTANKPYTQHATTYNLTVDDLHTYYVLAGKTPVLVHNSGPCDVPLKSLHPDSSLDESSLDFWHKQDTEDIAFSLRPGAHEPLITKPDGTIMNGNTRVAVLRSRGYDVDSLPRESYGGGRRMSDEDFWDMDQ